MRRSCEDLQIPHDIVRYNVEGDTWVEAASYKADFCLEMWQRHKRPIIWVDCDGYFVNRASLLTAGRHQDFAIHTRRRPWTWKPIGRKEPITLPVNWPTSLGPQWFSTGTIFFNYTPKAKAVLELWLDNTIDDRRGYQETALQRAWCDVGDVDTLWLPETYCMIDKGGRKDCCIRHNLASTEIHRVVRA